MDFLFTFWLLWSISLPFIWYSLGNWEIHWSSSNNARDLLKKVSSVLSLSIGCASLIKIYSKTKFHLHAFETWRYLYFSFWQGSNQRSHTKNWLKKSSGSTNFSSLLSTFRWHCSFSQFYHTPMSDITFSIWEQIHFIYFYPYGLNCSRMRKDAFYLDFKPFEMVFYIHFIHFEPQKNDRYSIQRRTRTKLEVEMKSFHFLLNRMCQWRDEWKRIIKIEFSLPLSKVPIWLEDAIWVFSGMVGAMLRGSSPGQHLYSVFEYFLRTRLAVHLHGWRHHTGCGGIQFHRLDTIKC